MFPYPFTAIDIYGNRVSEQTLGEKQVFFVHLWATWCGPCLTDMPYLAELAKDYGDRVGFIALITDYGDNRNGAANIVQDAEISDSFIMVDVYTQGLEEVVDVLESGYVPTTVLLYYYEGEWVFSEQIIGAKKDKYADELEKVLALAE
jgi:thiol-disulfide isomerase/thioredoxin